jgi:probable phosphoglycerate mutase
MATFYLLRHAHSVANAEGRLAGQTPGVFLSPIGKKQARAIAASISQLKIDFIYLSPMERCQETIEPYLRKNRKKVSIAPEFVEMNYGKWSNLKLSYLAKLPLWSRIQNKPSQVLFPKGESFLQAEKRVMRGLNRLSRRHPGKNILIVSHGDIIKLSISATLGLDIDKFQRIIIEPASLSIIHWSGRQRALLQVNHKLAHSSSPSRSARSLKVPGGSPHA